MKLAIFLAALLLPLRAAAQTFYFAATATDTGDLQSDFSDEITWTRTAANRTRELTLAWDPSSTTNIIAHYRIYLGLASRAYQTNFDAGTNLLLRLTLPPPAPITNRQFITLTLQTATNAAGPWTDWQCLRLTNPPSASLYRARATKSGGTWTLRPEQRELPAATWLTIPGWTNRAQTAKPALRFQIQ